MRPRCCRACSRPLGRNVGRGIGDAALFETGRSSCRAAVGRADPRRRPPPDRRGVGQLQGAVPTSRCTSRSALRRPRAGGLVGQGRRRPLVRRRRGGPRGRDRARGRRPRRRADAVRRGTRAAAPSCSSAGWSIGHAGELHPGVRGVRRPGPDRRRRDRPRRAAARDVDRCRAPPFSTYPVAKEDVALVVDATVPAGDVEAALREGAGELLESVRLFDVYTGEQVRRGARSRSRSRCASAPPTAP